MKGTIALPQELNVQRNSGFSFFIFHLFEAECSALFLSRVGINNPIGKSDGVGGARVDSSGAGRSWPPAILPGPLFQ